MQAAFVGPNGCRALGEKGFAYFTIIVLSFFERICYTVVTSHKYSKNLKDVVNNIYKC